MVKEESEAEAMNTDLFHNQNLWVFIKCAVQCSAVLMVKGTICLLWHIM